MPDLEVIPAPEEATADGLPEGFAEYIQKRIADERMIKWFGFDERAPQHILDVSRGYQELAVKIATGLEPGPERTAALRKLLESKDAALRAAVLPGG
jgi:hypothetical protein